MADPISSNANAIQPASIDQTQKTQDAGGVKAGADTPYVQAQQQQQAGNIDSNHRALQDMTAQLREMIQQARTQKQAQGQEQSRLPHGFKRLGARIAHGLNKQQGLMSQFRPHLDHQGGLSAMPGLEQTLTHMMSQLKAARVLSGQVPAGKTPLETPALSPGKTSLETPAMRPAELSPEQMSAARALSGQAPAGNAPPASDALFRDQVLHMTPDQIKTLLAGKSNMSPEVRNYLEAFVKYTDQPEVKDLQIAALKFQHDWHDGTPKAGTPEAKNYDADNKHLQDLEAKHPPPRPEDFGAVSTPPPDRNAPSTFTDTLFRDQVLRMTPDQIKPLLDQKSDLSPEAREYLSAFVKYTDQPAVKDLRLAAMRFHSHWPDGPPEKGTPEAKQYEEDKAQLQERMSKYPPPRPEEFGVTINQPQQQDVDPVLQSWLDDPAVEKFQAAKVSFYKTWPDGPPEAGTAKAEAYENDRGDLRDLKALCPTPPHPQDFALDGFNPDPPPVRSVPAGGPPPYLDGTLQDQVMRMTPDQLRAAINRADTTADMQSYLKAQLAYDEDPTVKDFFQAQQDFERKWSGDGHQNDPEFRDDLERLGQKGAQCPKLPTPEDFGIDGQNPDPSLAGDVPPPPELPADLQGPSDDPAVIELQQAVESFQQEWGDFSVNSEDYAEKKNEYTKAVQDLGTQIAAYYDSASSEYRT